MLVDVIKTLHRKYSFNLWNKKVHIGLAYIKNSLIGARTMRLFALTIVHWSMTSFKRNIAVRFSYEKFNVFYTRRKRKEHISDLFLQIITKRYDRAFAFVLFTASGFQALE